MDIKNKWWKDGIRFQCQGSGKCCVSRGQYGYVYFTKSDRERAASVLGIKTREFSAKYCDKSDGYFHAKSGQNTDNCIFLDGKRCGLYEGRPTQCRTWPFWSDVMGAKAWQKEVAEFCPGVGKGPLVPTEEIARQIEMQAKTEDET